MRASRQPPRQTELLCPVIFFTILCIVTLALCYVINKLLHFAASLHTQAKITNWNSGAPVVKPDGGILHPPQLKIIDCRVQWTPILYSLMSLPLFGLSRPTGFACSSNVPTDGCVKRVEQRLAAVFFCLSVWYYDSRGKWMLPCSHKGLWGPGGTLLLSNVACCCLVWVVWVQLFC